MIQTTPSELILHDDCSLAHDFRYRQRLRLKDEKRGGPLASGTTVHYVVETICRDFPGTRPDDTDVRLRAEECLRDEFRNDDDGGTRNVKRFLPGALRAIAKIPGWVWDGTWVVEAEVKGRFGTDGAIELHGRPDMWRLVNDETPVVEVVDVKTTDHPALDYVLWTPQVRMYAACLQQAFPDRLVVYRYLCVPTTGAASAASATPFVFTKAAYTQTEREIVEYVARLGDSPKPRYARRCAFCPFSALCIATITGADIAGVREDLYDVKSERDERGVLAEVVA